MTFCDEKFTLNVALVLLRGLCVFTCVCRIVITSILASVEAKVYTVSDF